VLHKLCLDTLDVGMRDTFAASGCADFDVPNVYSCAARFDRGILAAARRADQGNERVERHRATRQRGQP
jgi:hypothetical protein